MMHPFFDVLAETPKGSRETELVAFPATIINAAVGGPIMMQC